MTFVDVEEITETTDAVQHCSKACFKPPPKTRTESTVDLFHAVIIQS